MKNYKISVIVPVYNAEKYIRRCVDSIIAQTFTDFELLLIDDGSTDRSGKICDEYAENDKRVRVFHKENGGVSSARNIGLDNAEGHLICFCDSDDWVSKEWLQYFITEKDFDIIIQGYAYEKTCDNKVYYSKLSNLAGNKNDLDIMLMNCFSANNLGYLWCRAFKHSIIKKYSIRFNNEYILKEDECFIFHFLQYVDTFQMSDVCCYHYYYDTNVRIKYRKADPVLCGKCEYEILILLNSYSDTKLYKSILTRQISSIIYFIIEAYTKKYTIKEVETLLDLIRPFFYYVDVNNLPLYRKYFLLVNKSEFIGILCNRILLRDLCLFGLFKKIRNIVKICH